LTFLHLLTHVHVWTSVNSNGTCLFVYLGSRRWQLWGC